jgi:hypothetical protein
LAAGGRSGCRGRTGWRVECICSRRPPRAAARGSWPGRGSRLSLACTLIVPYGNRLDLHHVFRAVAKQLPKHKARWCSTSKPCAEWNPAARRPFDSLRRKTGVFTQSLNGRAPPGLLATLRVGMTKLRWPKSQRCTIGIPSRESQDPPFAREIVGVSSNRIGHQSAHRESKEGMFKKMMIGLGTLVAAAAHVRRKRRSPRSSRRQSSNRTPRPARKCMRNTAPHVMEPMERAMGRLQAL